MITRKLLFLLILNTALTTACVSVSVPKSEQVKASNIQFANPAYGFQANNQLQVDKSWINTKTGNSISYFSNCNDESDPGLKSIQYDVLSNLESPKILFSKFKNFNKRKALVTQVESLVDGYPTRFEVFIFKKNKCIYIINYIASTESFTSDYEAFQNFVQGFKVK